jgi:hypothetical protein
MAELEHYNIPDGTLNIEDVTNTQQLYNQFSDWMLVKSVLLTNEPKTAGDHSSSNLTNISREILHYLNNITELGYDKCFGKASFDKGGAFGKGGYSKNC